MKDKILLQEYLDNTTASMQTQTEVSEKDGVKEKSYYMEGIFIEGDLQNLNGRIYPKEEIERAVKDMQARLDAKQVIYGELDHPDELVVKLQNASHIIQKIEMKGSNGVGRLKIIKSTPKGAIAYGLLSEGLPIGVSSRGSGSVDEYTHEVSDFEIVTVDLVCQASAPDAYPTPIYESLNRSKSGNMVLRNFSDALSIHGDDVRYEKELQQGIVDFINELSWKGEI